MIGTSEVITLALIAVVAFLASKLQAYAKEAGKQAAIMANAAELSELREQGKNAATKKDIEEITHQIEGVKAEYSKDLERMKGDLSARIGQYGFRYEREFEILRELTKLLVAVRGRVAMLRPAFDVSPPEGETKESVLLGRLNEAHTALMKLQLASEENRPFYPDELYQSILTVIRRAHLEKTLVILTPIDFASRPPNYFLDGEESRQEIERLANQSLEAIRQRVREFDRLDG